MLVIAVSGFEKKKTNNDQEKCLPIIHNKQRTTSKKQKTKNNKTTKTIQNRKESELKIYKYLFFLYSLTWCYIRCFHHCSTTNQIIIS